MLNSGARGGCDSMRWNVAGPNVCSLFAKMQYDSENLAEGAQIIRSSYVDLLGKEPQGSNNCKNKC